MNRPTGKCNVSAASNAKIASLLSGDSKENVPPGSPRATSSRSPLADLHQPHSNAKATVTTPQSTLHKHAGVTSSSKSTELPLYACSAPTSAQNKTKKVKFAAATATVSSEKECVSNEPKVSDCMSKPISDTVNELKSATDKMIKQEDSALKEVKVLEKQLFEQKQHDKKHWNVEQLEMEKKAVEEAKAREMATLKLQTLKAAKFEKQATLDKIMLASLKKNIWKCPTCLASLKKKSLWECPICFETITDKTWLTVTPCGHVFCKLCISQVADAAEGRPKCPICQVDFFKCQLTQPFLDSFN